MGESKVDIDMKELSLPY